MPENIDQIILLVRTGQVTPGNRYRPLKTVASLGWDKCWNKTCKYQRGEENNIFTSIILLGLSRAVDCVHNSTIRFSNVLQVTCNKIVINYFLFNKISRSFLRKELTKLDSHHLHTHTYVESRAQMEKNKGLQAIRGPHRKIIILKKIICFLETNR